MTYILPPRESLPVNDRKCIGRRVRHQTSSAFTLTKERKFSTAKTTTTTPTDEAEHDGQQNEPVGSADDDDAEIHSEIEHFEDLRVCEREHNNAAEFGQRDPAEHLQEVS